MVVSPDGSLRRSIFTDASLGFEAKCRSSNVNALPVYYRIPPMHVHNQSIRKSRQFCVRFGYVCTWIGLIYKMTYMDSLRSCRYFSFALLGVLTSPFGGTSICSLGFASVSDPGRTWLPSSNSHMLMLLIFWKGNCIFFQPILLVFFKQVKDFDTEFLLNYSKGWLLFIHLKCVLFYLGLLFILHSWLFLKNIYYYSIICSNSTEINYFIKWQHFQNLGQSVTVSEKISTFHEVIGDNEYTTMKIR